MERDLEQAHIRALLSQHMQGQLQAFGEFMEHFSQPLMTYLQRVGVRSENREDLLQDIFVAIHKNAARYDSALSLRSWVFTIAVNKVRDHFNRDRWLRWLPIEKFFTPVESHNPEKQFSNQQEVHELQQSLQELSLLQREALIMQSIHGMEISEIARIQKLPENTVKTNLRRARESLMKKISKAGVAS